jgi:hypothetical protein
MKRVLSFVCISSFALAVSLAAQATPPAQPPLAPTQAPAKIGTEADYAAHMKEIGQLNGVLNKSIKGGMTDEALKAATRLEVLFKNIHGYWNEKKVTDASTVATTALTSLQSLQTALKANDMTGAETARATFSGVCMTCHAAHREKTPEGGWRMK